METWHAFASLGGFSATATMATLLVLLAALLVWRHRRGTRSRRRSSGDRVLSSSDAVERAPVGLRQGLAKTRTGLLHRVLPLLGRDRLDQIAVETLEAALLAADVGVRMTERLIRSLDTGREGSGAAVKIRLERELLAILEAPRPGKTDSDVEFRDQIRPRVIMVVGVNGVGKTTTIGKLAARYERAGQRTLLVAGDTFRAAAIEQLGVWAERSGADLVRHQHGADPGAVAYDGMRAAMARGVEVVIVDTAGRLHTKSNLMEELRKVQRVIAREIPGAPHETLLIIDSVTGQNGLVQGRIFLEQIEVTGVVLTKLDGTAKGGVVVAIAGELGLPIRYVGVGEGVDDLQEFSPREFASALLEGSEPIGFS